MLAAVNVLQLFSLLLTSFLMMATAATSIAGSINGCEPIKQLHQQEQRLKVVVVGGGPAGAATAMSLAQQGHAVDLYEAYPSPRTIADKNSPKAYVIALGLRGQAGLQQATGIPPQDVTGGIMAKHFVRHSTVTKKATVMPREPAALIVPRQLLAQHILDQAAKAGVVIHYEHRLVDVNVHKRTVTFDPHDQTSKSNQPPVEVQYDLLVGADGSNSQTRKLLQDKVDTFRVRSEEDSMEYQVAVLDKSPFSDDAATPKDASHSWNCKAYNSICLAFPLMSGKMLFAIVFPEGKLKEFQQQSENGGGGYDEALAALFPDLQQEVINQLVEQLKVGEPANGGLCVWSSALGSPEHGIALVGDSGHGMWPSLGQGANCALESTAVFCQTCSDVCARRGASAATTKHDSPETLATAIVQEFNARRHRDATAAVDLTYGGIGARQSRGRQNAPLSYRLQIVGIMLLHKATGGIVPKPALLRLMGNDSVSYSTAHNFNFYYERAICLSTVALLLVGGRMAALAFLRKQ